jgi:hypothetical protein
MKSDYTKLLVRIVATCVLINAGSPAFAIDIKGKCPDLWAETVDVQDCNRNGVPDSCDISSGTSQDFDGSGIPYECQTSPDCNRDRVNDLAQMRPATDQIRQESRAFMSYGPYPYPPNPLRPLDQGGFTADWGDVVVADIDGDGRNDIVSVRNTVPFLFATRSGGATGLQPLRGLLVAGGQQVQAFPTSLGVADIDNDGDRDLVIAHSGVAHFGLNAALTILFNDGSGNFPVRQMFPLPASSPRTLWVGDINGDLLGDVVIGQAASAPAVGDIMVYTGLRTSTGGFTLQLRGPYFFAGQPGSSYTEAFDFDLTDLDSDRDLDLVVAVRTAIGFGRVAILFQEGLNSGSFALHQQLSLPLFNPRSVAVGDVDADGVKEIVVAANNFTTVTTTDRWSELAFLKRSAGGQYAVQRTLRVTPRPLIRIADIDHDRDLDVVLHSSANFTPGFPNEQLGLLYNENNGLQWRLEATNYENLSGIGESRLRVADFRREGFFDFVTQTNLGTTVISGLSRPQLFDRNWDYIPDVCQR